MTHPADTHAYPADIRPLTGLRFVAAFWLLLYFFGERFAQWGVPPIALVSYGNYGVDLFFILSGFVLAHVYGPAVDARRFHHGSFIWARLARIYPTHLLTLLMMVVLWAGAKAMGAELQEQAFNLAHIPAHLLMIHAWGVVNADGWNFPSWSISAEWFAYLGFPLLFGAVALLVRTGKGVLGPLAALGASIGLFYTLYLFFAHGGTELTDLTWGGGALRIIPSFLAGIALWRLGQEISIPRPVALGGLLAAAAGVALAWRLDIGGAGVWPCLLAVVFLAAELSKTGNSGLMGNRTWVWLGEISFAIYMVHLPVDVVYFQVIERLQGVPAGMWIPIHFGLATVLSIIAGALVHHWWEKPCRTWMRDHPPSFARAPKSAPSG